MSTEPKKTDISFGELILGTLEGEVSREQFDYFQKQIIENPSAREYYFEFLTTYLGFSSYEACAPSFLSLEDTAELYNHIFTEFAKMEETAPSCEMPKKIPEIDLDELVEETPPAKIEYKFSKRSFFALVAATVTIIFSFFFLYYLDRNARQGESGVLAAILSDSLDAKWADMDRPLNPGTGLAAKTENLLLREGYAELLFENEVRLAIEGPAEFQVLAGDMLKLNYGQVYATVPPQGYGFQVATPSSKVIDLGTEFGVKQDMDGDFELHVIKGKTVLISEVQNRRMRVDVSANMARSLNGRTGDLEEISCDGHLFVRRVDSKKSLAWRGQPLSLADIVGGGGGFGSGTLNLGFDPNSQQSKIFTKATGALVGSADYQPLDGQPYIDGIFIPNGESGPVQISTQGHVFEECPVTDGQYWGGTFNGAWHQGGGYHVPRHNLRLDGVVYGTKKHPAIYMHANQGITFDLNAIRKGLKDFRVTRLSAKTGLSQSLLDFPDQLKRGTAKAIYPKASFYVLVDGVVRFTSTDRVPLDPAVDIDIELTETDRFLTLVTTQGSDGENTYDWTLFAEPFLHIERLEM